jgi:putative transposase
MNKYNASTHSTYNVGYHIVFCAKYRYNLLRYRAVERLKTLLRQSACDLGISILAMEVMQDHVHLFIVARPAVQVPQMIRRLKGYSSYCMQKEFAYLRRYPSLWTRSYFVETVGHISENTVVNYIEHQKTNFCTLTSPG